MKGKTKRQNGSESSNTARQDTSLRKSDRRYLLNSARDKVEDADIYPWQSISLFRNGFSSLDFVVRDEPSTTPLMAFLHVMYASVYRTADVKAFITKINHIKFRMKLSHSCHERAISFKELFLQAISKTIKEQL